ncbi:MAG: single-stranded-DNA-specific exonuclease RecJ [Phycisphaerales bacterium JB043]
MHGMRYRWGLADTDASLSPEPGLEPLVARVLSSRGYSLEEARRFLAVSMQDLEEPSRTPGIDRGAEMILEAATSGKKIVVYGDYDVDGTTSIAILIRTLVILCPDVSIGWYVPHRLEEGYGLNASALREIRDGGADLVVSVDCGISAIDEAREARRLGLGLIITDHHNPRADGLLPDAETIVHPRIAYEDGSPPTCAPEPAGAGVAFKLAWQMCVRSAGSERVGDVLQRHLLDMLALAALGTIADVVPLTGENRVIARHGLRMLRQCEITGVRALLEASGLNDDSISEEKVGFVLAPRINACGRMGHASEAVELLLTQDESRAHQIARSMTSLNDERRATEQGILKEAIAMGQEEGLHEPGVRGVVLARSNWHPGVIGIVCSRIVDLWHKPTILLQRGEHECAGSGRSIDGFSLSSALGECDEYLLSHGGHDMAAGLRVATDTLDRFRDAFMALAESRLDESDLTPRLRVDCECSLQELTISSGRQLARFAPFGRQNTRPLVLLRGARLTRAPMVMGKGNNHLSLQVTSERGGSLRLVGWRWGEHADDFHEGMELDVVLEPSLNSWRGRESIEGVMRDARVLTGDASAHVVTATSSIPS